MGVDESSYGRKATMLPALAHLMTVNGLRANNLDDGSWEDRHPTIMVGAETTASEPPPKRARVNPTPKPVEYFTPDLIGIMDQLNIAQL